MDPDHWFFGKWTCNNRINKDFYSQHCTYILQEEAQSYHHIWSIYHAPIRVPYRLPYIEKCHLPVKYPKYSYWTYLSGKLFLSTTTREDTFFFLISKASFRFHLMFRCLRIRYWRPQWFKTGSGNFGRNETAQINRKGDRSLTPWWFCFLRKKPGRKVH